MDTIDGETRCSSIGCVGKRLGPRIWGKRLEPTVPDEIYRILEDGEEADEKIASASEIPQSLEEFVAEMRSNRSDAKTFALKLKAMVWY
ncbi:hypothetical protein ACLOJK_029279 [Asimina triloba]